MVEREEGKDARREGREDTNSAARGEDARILPGPRRTVAPGEDGTIS